MLLRPQEAEAEDGDAMAGPVEEAIRRPAAAGVVEPAAAPKHPVRARPGTSGIRYHTARIVADPVRDPLPHVPSMS